MKKTNLSSLKIHQNPEHLHIQGDFDFPVEIEYNKSQVTEQLALKEALTEINSTLSPELLARLSDSKQCKFSRKGNDVVQVGIDLYTRN